MTANLNHPLTSVEVSRAAVERGSLVEFGGPNWRASESECRRWYREGTRFYMHDLDTGKILEVYLDETSFLSMPPRWRCSGDKPHQRQLMRLPRMVADADLIGSRTAVK